MGLDLLPKSVRELYEVEEWRHACTILKYEFPEEWNDVLSVLQNFRLLESDILSGGGNKSPIAKKLDGKLYALGWAEKQFDTRFVVDERVTESPTHKVDCFKNRVALEVEWNNKDPFFDRDLNNFRLLFEMRVISVGIIITRCDELQDIFNVLGKGSSYGQATTHWNKLVPKIKGGGGGGCPILAFGISRKLYVPGK